MGKGKRFWYNIRVVGNDQPGSFNKKNTKKVFLSTQKQKSLKKVFIFTIKQKSLNIF